MECPYVSVTFLPFLEFRNNLTTLQTQCIVAAVTSRARTTVLISWLLKHAQLRQTITAAMLTTPIILPHTLPDLQPTFISFSLVFANDRGETHDD